MLPFLDIIVSPHERHLGPVIHRPTPQLDTVVNTKDTVCDTITVGKDSLVDTLSSMSPLTDGLCASNADSSMLVWTIVISFAALMACLAIARLYGRKN